MKSLLEALLNGQNAILKALTKKDDLVEVKKDNDERPKIAIKRKVTEEAKVETKVEIRMEKTRSGRGIWVSGDLKGMADDMIGMGGSWNTSKKAWVFSHKRKQVLLDYFKMNENQIGQET